MIHKHAKLAYDYVSIMSQSMLNMQPEVKNPNSRVVAPTSRGRKLLALSLWKTRRLGVGSPSIHAIIKLGDSYWKQMGGRAIEAPPSVEEAFTVLMDGVALVLAGVAVSVFRRSQFSGLRPRLDDSDTKRLPNTSLYNQIRPLYTG